MLIAVDAAPASDGWGFVGRVLVGEHEAYRTLRAYPTPGEALSAAKILVGDVLGSFLAGQEWHTAEEDVRQGLAPTDADEAAIEEDDAGLSAVEQV